MLLAVTMSFNVSCLYSLRHSNAELETRCIITSTACFKGISLKLKRQTKAYLLLSLLLWQSHWPPKSPSKDLKLSGAYSSRNSLLAFKPSSLASIRLSYLALLPGNALFNLLGYNMSQDCPSLLNIQVGWYSLLSHSFFCCQL